MYADFGRIFKTEYTVAIEGEQISQVIYMFYIDKYGVQITVTDAGDGAKFRKDVEYMLDSFTLK